MMHVDSSRTRTGSSAIKLWIGFSLFILYGTLIPFNACFDKVEIVSNIARISWIPFIDPDGSRASIPDIVQNVLLFLPFGFLGGFTLKAKPTTAILRVVFMGMLLSLTVEILQLFTIDRTTSMTDLVTNTIGSLGGALTAVIAKRVYQELMVVPQFSKYRHDKLFLLLLITFTFVAAGALQPFDFTLDVGSVYSKIKAVFHHPFAFDLVIKDELVVFFRFSLFGYVCSLWLKKNSHVDFLVKGIALSTISGAIFEGCQFFIASRMPTAQDVLVVVLGSSAGGIFAAISFKEKPKALWTVLCILATWISAGIQVLSPFRISSHYQGMSWIPFFPYYERVIFIGLSDFIESMVMFFPMGFILMYLHRSTKNSIIWIVVLSIIMAFSLEGSQGWIEGRYPDITDILGTVTGAIAGIWICRTWMTAYGDPSTQEKSNLIFE